MKDKKDDDIIKLLTNNMVKLTKIQENNYYSMLDEINKLKKDNEILNTKLKNDQLKRLQEILNKESESESEIKNKKQKLDNNKHKIIYDITSLSYSEEKINEILYGLNSIEDIIKLDNIWLNIRHNNKLQKLSNIILPLTKLNNMVGLKKIKEELFKIIIYYIQNVNIQEYLHTVIYGPPGVGKTEFAKIYGEIFLNLGILKTNNFIEIKKDDIVAKYLGQTSHQTKALLEKGMGGVIFLDEAYSLGNAEKKDSFAKEAIDMINQYLSERKNEFMFIVAGYEEDLEDCFFSFNKGLKRRFSHYFKIDKYSDNELLGIFKLKIKQFNYNLDVEENQLSTFFKNNYHTFKNYAGDIEKLVNYTKYEQSLRCFKENKTNNNLIMNDILLGYNKLSEQNKTKTKLKSPPIGMYI
jgi:SpoVK/Ycf46/Vps4 family AAA+-type ATPase